MSFGVDTSSGRANCLMRRLPVSRSAIDGIIEELMEF